MNDPRAKILILVLAILLVGGIIVGVVAYRADIGRVAGESGVAVLQADESRYDFGDIPITGGLVRHNFSLTNTGDADLKLSDIKTSCMCTVAYLEAGGQRSPQFGMPGHNNPTAWSQTIAPGATATLEVIFDPLAHGPNAVGPITRTVTVTSNSGGRNGVTNFTFTANVTR